MKKWMRLAALTLCGALVLSGCGSAAQSTQTAASTAESMAATEQPAKTAALDPEKPTTITVWHYYNGAQQSEFSEMVQEFNTTVGAEMGIHVEEYSQGSVNDLSDGVLASAEKKVGAAELPNIFSAYADTVFAADRLGVVADLSPWLTESEKQLYIDDYMEEGFLSGDALKIFPVAKSTEVMMLNKTDWDTFAAATGAKLSQLDTVEGVTETAKAYYDWTDAATPDVENDGKAFFGRDAFANYMILGAMQQGTEIIAAENGVGALNYDKTTVRKLWDNYYVPMVAGWFAEINRFRSDDIKMGGIIACVCSTSSATYFPEEVLTSDTEGYPIEMCVQAAPQFAGGKSYAVQQGAGMAVTNGTDAEIYASVVFLKWLTEPQRNAQFSLGSGYLPVTKEASTLSYLSAAMDAAGTDDKMRAVLEVAVTTTEECTMYTPRACSSGAAVRSALNVAMPEKAMADRAALLAAVEAGTPYEEALAQYTSDECFESWYAETLAALEAING